MPQKASKSSDSPKVLNIFFKVMNYFRLKWKIFYWYFFYGFLCHSSLSAVPTAVLAAVDVYVEVEG